MKGQGRDSRSSVINNANMVVLNFAKGGKSVSFTIMRMGDKTNVLADGSALKVGAGGSAGTDVKNPYGPTLDLPPGKYKYSIKPQGKPSQSDEVDLGADEIWGLMIGPGGVLALQAY
jgi:hypothetical protein